MYSIMTNRKLLLVPAVVANQNLILDTKKPVFDKRQAEILF